MKYQNTDNKNKKKTETQKKYHSMPRKKNSQRQGVIQRCRQRGCFKKQGFR